MELPTEVKITSHRPFIGRFIVAYKKLVGFLVSPYLKNVFEEEHKIINNIFNEVNNRFNEVNNRFNIVTTDTLKRTDALFVTLDQRLETLDVRQEHLKGELEKRQEDLKGELEKGQEDVGKRYIELFQRQMELNQGHILLRRKLEVILSELNKRYQLTEQGLKKVTNQRDGLSDHDYLVFENIYRGTQEEIGRRQEIYTPYFKGRNGVLDIGCGRGEFLDILRNNGIEAQGVDTNEDMVFCCKEKGLKVEKADAISYLEDLDDNSLHGIFSSHLIEHLPNDKIVELIRLCYRKLAPGAYCVFETPNPTSVMAFTRNFLIDPSHQTPLHYEAIRFFYETSGFKDVEVKYLSPFPDEMKLQRLPVDAESMEKGKIVIKANQVIDKLNDILYGFQDYAVIGKK